MHRKSQIVPIVIESILVIMVALTAGCKKEDGFPFFPFSSWDVPS